MERGIAAFGQGDRESAFADVVGGLDEAGANRIGNKALQRAFLIQIDSADQPRRRFDQHNGIAASLKSEDVTCARFSIKPTMPSTGVG